MSVLPRTLDVDVSRIVCARPALRLVRPTRSTALSPDCPGIGSRRRTGASPVAAALNRARRRGRGESLQAAARGSGLPIRYVAAFELDRAPLVFRSGQVAAAFVAEYARHLGLDPELVAARFLEGYRLPVPRTAPRTPRLAVPPGRRTTAVASLGVALAVSLVAAVVGWAGPGPHGSQGGPTIDTFAPRDAPAPRRPALPLGGRRLFPDYRVVAVYGSPITPRMGRLGAGSPAEVGRSLRLQARAYASPGRPVLPAFDLVVTVTSSSPGTDGTHTFRLSEDRIDGYLAEVRRLGGLLVLDIQPGRIPFDLEIRRFEQLLRLPDVGVALDPEWRVHQGQLPGQTVGSVDAAEVNRAIDYVAGLVRRFDLPQKLLVIHQFNHAMVTDRSHIHDPPEVAVTFDFDGVGSIREKVLTYAALARGLGGAAVGIKLYHDQDAGLMTPGQVVGLDPEPDLIVYQ